MGSFTPAGSGGLPGGGSSTPVGTTPAVANVMIPSANTEVSFALPANTKWFVIKLRNTAILKLAYGPLASDYWTVPAGAYYAESEIGATSITLYFQSSQPTSVAEIVSWS